MEKEQRDALMWRWSLISAGAIALFWAIYWMVTGEVPYAFTVKTFLTEEINLPVGLSRWWDILLGPLWTCLAILLWWDNPNLKTVIYFSLMGIIISGVWIIAGSALGFVVTTLMSIIFGIIGGFVLGFCTHNDKVLWLALSLPFSAGLWVGLIYGIICSVATFFISIISFVIGVILYNILTLVVSKKIWQTIGHFLLAQDKVKTN